MLWEKIPRDLKRLIWTFVWVPRPVRYPSFVGHVNSEHLFVKAINLYVCRHVNSTCRATSSPVQSFKGLVTCELLTGSLLVVVAFSL